MSKNCRIEFAEGELTRLCNHRDYRNCDLHEEDEETYDGWGRGRMNYWEMLKAISPFDYSKRNKLTDHTELCGKEEE